MRRHLHIPRLHNMLILFTYKYPRKINFVKDAMFGSTNEVMGTSYKSRIDNPKYQFAGKTGTAQIVEKGVYTNKKINTFTSIFPSSNPKYVLVVLLEDTKLSKDYEYKYSKN